jgi:hypothetical protein
VNTRPGTASKAASASLPGNASRVWRGFLDRRHFLRRLQMRGQHLNDRPLTRRFCTLWRRRVVPRSCGLCPGPTRRMRAFDVLINDRLEQAICPTGKSPSISCPVPRIKIFRLTCRANQRHYFARLTQSRGGSRSSRTCGGMRWTRKAHKTKAPDAYGESCGPDAAVLASSRAVAHRSNWIERGICAATVAKEPFTGESTK